MVEFIAVETILFLTQRVIAAVLASEAENSAVQRLFSAFLFASSIARFASALP